MAAFLKAPRKNETLFEIATNIIEVTIMYLVSNFPKDLAHLAIVTSLFDSGASISVMVTYA